MIHLRRALLVVAGVAAVVVLPQDTSRPARLDTPVAVVAPPVAATAGTPAATAAPAVPASEVRQLPASPPVRIQIPALGVTSRIMRLGLKAEMKLTHMSAGGGPAMIPRSAQVTASSA